MRGIIGSMWLTGLLALCPPGLHAQQVQVSSTNRTVAVTTSAEAGRRADTALVHVGYQLYGPTSPGVAAQAAAVSKAVVGALVGVGVSQDTIESQQQGTAAAPDMRNSALTPAEQEQRRFEAQQSWTVRVAAADAARTLAAAVAAGANESGAIDWSVADEAALTAEAAGNALQHARAIADQMASGLGAKLGPLVYASNEAQPLRILPRMVRSMDIPPLASAQQVELSLGAPMVRVSATVSAVFALQ